MHMPTISIMVVRAQIGWIRRKVYVELQKTTRYYDTMLHDLTFRVVLLEATMFFGLLYLPSCQGFVTFIYKLMLNSLGFSYSSLFSIPTY